MTPTIEGHAVAMTGLAQKTLEVAIEVAQGGVTPAELPALELYCDNVEAAVARLRAAGRESASRYQAVQECVAELRVARGVAA